MVKREKIMPKYRLRKVATLETENAAFLTVLGDLPKQTKLLGLH